MRGRYEIVSIEDKAGICSCSTLTFLSIFRGDNSPKHQRPYLEVIPTISLRVLWITLPLTMAEFGFTNAFDGYGSAQSSADTPSREPPPVRRPPTAHEPPPKYTENTRSRTNLGGPLPERSSELPVIAVMGPTGSGKSTLINTIAGRPVKIGHNLESCQYT